MSSRLDRIKNWQDLSIKANYSASDLARLCGVSVRQLQRYFLECFKRTPHSWLHTLRQQRALELMKDGCTVKEAAGLLGYKTPNHFSYDFKKTHGIPPVRYAIDTV